MEEIIKLENKIKEMKAKKISLLEKFKIPEKFLPFPYLLQGEIKNNYIKFKKNENNAYKEINNIIFYLELELYIMQDKNIEYLTKHKSILIAKNGIKNRLNAFGIYKNRLLENNNLDIKMIFNVIMHIKYLECLNTHFSNTHFSNTYFPNNNDIGDY